MRDIKKASKDLPVMMNPYDEENSEPNFLAELSADRAGGDVPPGEGRTGGCLYQ